jgi:lysylphosphatidylglycerol synthetase-like protein (DUF2156 family)
VSIPVVVAVVVVIVLLMVGGGGGGDNWWWVVVVVVILVVVVSFGKNLVLRDSMLNLSDAIRKCHTIAIFVIVDLWTVFHS